MIDLGIYDLIVVNSSAGKDSQTALDVTVEAATNQGVDDRLVVLHCDLDQAEWPGTVDIARRQAAAYKVPFEVERHARGLLARVAERGMWPGPTTRYCTSELKTAISKRATTRMLVQRGLDRASTGRRANVLHVLGLRAAESPARARKVEFESEIAGSSGARRIDRWLPIHRWSDVAVWDRIRQSGVKHHYAYNLGMPRVSCSFCILASPGALMRAALERPDLADRYVALEAAIGHQFRADMSMADIVTEARRRQSSGEPLPQITSWSETGGCTPDEQLELDLAGAA